MAFKRRQEYWTEETPETYRSGTLEVRLYEKARIFQFVRLFHDKASGEMKPSRLVSVGFDELAASKDMALMLSDFAEQAYEASKSQQSNAAAGAA